MKTDIQWFSTIFGGHQQFFMKKSTVFAEETDKNYFEWFPKSYLDSFHASFCDIVEFYFSSLLLLSKAWI